ncbi:MAG TPA: hypothetical protein PKD70_08675 [Saprospiraceae bacterium]|nr:hypothetical protein [Saprospiraceae bacterium]HMP13942.1 hypothetical protein [Saprospiraceae bacterium]
MRAIVKFLPLLLIVIACNQSKPEAYSADNTLDSNAQQAFLYDIIRYMGKLPGKANQMTKFEAVFDDHYREQAARHRLELYYNDAKTGDIYFLTSRIAPSIKVKRVAIGGKLRRDEQGKVVYYEEVFRTWKMEEPEMKEKSGMLFVKMLKGEDLSLYYPENSGKEEYIEFPNQDVYFDVAQRVWASRLEDPLAPYYELKMRQMND